MASEGIRRAERKRSRLSRRLIRLFIAGMLCLHLLFFFQLRARILHGYPDFTVFYTAAKILRQGLGSQLYDAKTQYRVQAEFAGGIDSRHGPLPYIHPPFEAVVFVPLTLLPYRAAFIAWELLNGVMLFGVAVIARRRLDALQAIPSWEFVLGFLAFFPVFLCLFQGQDSILLLLVFTLTYAALKKDADVLAGCWLAMGMTKLQFAVPLLVLLVLWGRKKVNAGFAGVVVVLAALSFLLVGWQGAMRYPAYVLQIARESGLGGVPAELMPNLRGLIEGWSWKLSPELLTGVVAVASMALIVFAVWRGSAGIRSRIDLQFALAVVVAALISWHTNAHDLSILVLPLLLVANYWWGKDTSGRRFALLLPVLPLLLSPLWIGLWLGVSKLNLMAIPLCWWGWEIGRELKAVQAASEFTASSDVSSGVIGS